MTARTIDQVLGAWIRQRGPEGDVVISSRVRVARNLVGIPFPRFAKPEALKQVLDKVKAVTRPDAGLGELTFIPLAKVPPLERGMLVEKHLISPAQAEDVEYKAVVLRADEMISVMVNEEDHLRIQVIYPGLDIDAAWELASRVDDFYEKQLDLAFSEKRGYLTACPTNVGTGLRASVMLHLPALTSTNQIQRIVSASAKLNLAVRGIYGEGTAAVGNIYQVSNQVTLGHAESDIVQHLTAVARQIIEQERAAREALRKKMPVMVDDRVHRAYGLLANARRIETQEALQLLSDVRMGAEMGILTELDPTSLNGLTLAIRPSILQRIAGRELSPEERDIQRATLIREMMRPVGR